jgi:hypothetical protein
MASLSPPLAITTQSLKGEESFLGNLMPRSLLRGSSLIVEIPTRESYRLVATVIINEAVPDKAAVKSGKIAIGTSALLTTTMEGQKKLELALKKAGLKGKSRTMVGGTPVTQRWADRIGADAYAENAIDGIKKAKLLIGIL